MDQRLPLRRPATPGSFDAQPAHVEQWIAALPVLNVGETTRLLFNALVEFNTLEMPTAQRMKSLELLRVPVRNITETLKKHYVGHSFPLAPKGRKVAELSKEMLNQLAIGYRIVVAEERDKPRFRRDKRLLATAMHRALACLGLVLLKAYQVYAPYPPGVWREVHRLYEQASERGLLEHAVRDAGEDGIALTIEDAYKQILLLALACPYRLRQGEVEQVFRALENWSREAELTDLVEAPNPGGLFIVNLASDDPPSYLILRHTRYDRAHCRLLDTARLAETVRHAFTDRNQGRAGPGVPSETILRRLMLSWGVMPRRRYSRTEKAATAVVAMGLSATHYFISGENTFSADSGDAEAPHYDARATFTARETRERENEVPDVWDLAETRRWRSDDNHRIRMVDFPAQPSKLAPKSPPPLETEPHPPEYHTHEWKMVDVSAGGYRLLWDSGENSEAEVGELVGIREASDPDAFHMGLGVVRWMKCAEGRGLELGVQMIAPGGVAVGTKKAGAREYLRSLILPEIRAIGQPATLITPTLPYHVGDQVLVNSHGKEARVELTKLVENTGAFAQFQFRPLDSRASSSQGDSADGSNSGFDELWEQI
ncbi:hypothetical protein [Thiohalobacter sp.]|uniref:hypothetical protein n=1 Tax=Thiohalobacter sp. TaxID=2025948 RepID=UPI002604DEEB|nr:hypothetical protein [Thiohalobacter sp.]